MLEKQEELYSFQKMSFDFWFEDFSSTFFLTLGLHVFDLSQVLPDSSGEKA